ncbi:MAG: hypothetical protein P0S94_00120 [Simkaniaceae bacterium]|nr:hypothetical protein [Simkaniaceae bacterium]
MSLSIGSTYNFILKPTALVDNHFLSSFGNDFYSIPSGFGRGDFTGGNFFGTRIFQATVLDNGNLQPSEGKEMFGSYKSLANKACCILVGDEEKPRVLTGREYSDLCKKLHLTAKDLLTPR